MNTLRRIISFIYYDTFGGIATAFFLICCLSGIFLVIPYDVKNPYESISYFLLTDPAAVLFRNIHYWSAQLFLVFIIIHFWDHFYKSTETRVKKGIWLRLTISIIAIFYVMISGFILKADTDAQEAREILSSLIASIPLAGNFISYALLGPSEDYQVIYVHHIATATIFLFIINFEHARIIWGKAKTFIISSIIILVVSYIFQAPLHDNYDFIIKGPWYFLGLQEVLNWMRHPGYILLAILILLIIIYFIPKLSNSRSRIVKWALFVFFIFYMVVTIIGCCFRGENWEWKWSDTESDHAFSFEYINFTSFSNDSLMLDIPVINGRSEGCMGCHAEMKGFTESHNPEAIGCVSCHAGNPFTPDKKQAHNNMILIPGNFDKVERTCGTAECHPEIVSRIDNSLMTTLSGIVSVDRYVFNELPGPSYKSRITDIGHTPADKHLRDLCASCHLGNPKTAYGPIDQLSRGGGCNACHINYSEQALKELDSIYNDRIAVDTDIKFHPQLSIQVTNDHCFGCHSRSGRIPTNYEGWHETKLEESEIYGMEGYRILDDHRVFTFIHEDIHHELGMECIDCHYSYELMGDGTFYLHEEEQVKIRCEDCHPVAEPGIITYPDFDYESRKIADLRGLEKNKTRKYLAVAETGYPLLNTYLDEEERAWLITKNSSDTLLIKFPAEICTRGASHASLTCKSCHASWAPQCIGCHHVFDKNSEGYDLLDNKFITGEWVEYVGAYFADKPVLGVKEATSDTATRKRIETFVAGMVLSIDMESFSEEYKDDPEIFHRLFSPVSPHTTIREGRSCKSCHNDPNTLGYGRGQLEYIITEGEGKWRFRPRFAKNRYDHLPEDAWIGFLAERIRNVSTRENHRPFTIEEQQRILTVGACLTCHDEDSVVMLSSLDDFEEVLKRKNQQCILPDW